MPRQDLPAQYQHSNQAELRWNFPRKSKALQRYLLHSKYHNGSFVQHQSAVAHKHFHSQQQIDSDESSCTTENTAERPLGVQKNRAKPAFPKNRHRLLSKKIEARRSTNKQSATAPAKPPPPNPFKGDASTKSNTSSSFPKAGIKEAKVKPVNLRESLQEIAYSANSWGGLTVPVSREFDEEKKSFLPTTLEASISLEASMNDVSGNTISTRCEDDESDRDVCNRLIVRPLTEDKPKKFPVNPARSLSPVQLRKQTVQRVVEAAIDQYSQSLSSLVAESIDRKRHSDRLTESDSALVRFESGNYAHHLRKQPWNPHNMPYY